MVVTQAPANATPKTTGTKPDARMADQAKAPHVRRCQASAPRELQEESSAISWIRKTWNHITTTVMTIRESEGHSRHRNTHHRHYDQRWRRKRTKRAEKTGKRLAAIRTALTAKAENEPHKQRSAPAPPTPLCEAPTGSAPRAGPCKGIQQTSGKADAKRSRFTT